MRSTLRVRVARVLGGGALMAALLLPAVVPASAVEAPGDPVILRVGTTQDLDTLNPYGTLLVVGYEAFGLSYNLLVDFGPDLEPVPGFADSWERAEDGHSWIFHIREGMVWSDGEPATAADACFSWQLALDAIADGGPGTLGAGYLDPGLDDAAVTAVECPDANTMIATTDDPSDRILQTYLPIIPQHIWGEEDHTTIGEAVFEPTLVGTGPYQAVEWQTGQFIRFQRNESYWGTQGFADEIDIIIYNSADTMVQALKAGELDYAHGPNAEQLNELQSEPNIETVVGSANGWTQLAFNTYGTGTDKTIEGGGPSTPALKDQAFRDALGYAVDHELLVERVLGGYGDVGTTMVPPVLTQWHVEPTNKRTFDIELAKQKLEDAGYTLNGAGERLDKEGNPISLSLLMPDSDDNYPKAAQFVADWYGELGINVTTQVLDSATLGEIVLPPEAGEGYTADYDIELWGWSGNVDPNGLMAIFKCDAIGSSSDSQYCNPEYDALYEEQLVAQTAEERKELLTQMQNIIYDDAPYDILYYDANLEAYRTDRFAGWSNQPSANGTPFFTYSTLQYTKLVNAVAEASAAPSAAASGGAAPTAAATPAPGDGTAASSNSMLIIAAVVIVAVIAVGLVAYSRRRSTAARAEEE